MSRNTLNTLKEFNITASKKGEFFPCLLWAKNSA